jgi:anti-sigma B factor antagonist
MHLEIQQRDREGITLLDLKGRLVAGDEVAAFRSTVELLSLGEAPKIILNLRHVDYIDSLGLGTMVMCYTRLQKVGGIAKLTQLNRRTLELLLLTKIDTIFEVFDDETEAVNSFFPEREIRRFDILEFVEQMKKDKKERG